MAVKRSALLLSAVVVLVSLFLVSLCGTQAIEGCPPVDDRDDNATLLVNPLNCSTFYMCRQGTPLLFECPADLHFSHALNVCDYPLRANCVLSEPTPVPSLTEVVTAKDITMLESANNHSETVTNVQTVANAEATAALGAAAAAVGVSLGDLLSTPVTTTEGRPSTLADLDTDLHGVPTEAEKSAKDDINIGRQARALGFIVGASIGVSLLVPSFALLHFLRARYKCSKATHFCRPK